MLVGASAVTASVNSSNDKGNKIKVDPMAKSPTGLTSQGTLTTTPSNVQVLETSVAVGDNADSDAEQVVPSSIHSRGISSIEEAAQRVDLLRNCRGIRLVLFYLGFSTDRLVQHYFPFKVMF